MPWGQGQGALWHTRSSPDTTADIMLCRKTKHLWCSHLETVCAWTWGRQVFLAFGRPGWPALHPAQLTISVKAPRSFPESLSPVTGLQRPQPTTRRHQLKGTSTLQWAQLTHSKVPCSWLTAVLPAVQMWRTEQQAGSEPSQILPVTWAARLGCVEQCLSQLLLTLLQHTCVNTTNYTNTANIFLLFSEQRYRKSHFKQEKSKAEVTTKPRVK